jgi:hypothetical protein
LMIVLMADLSLMMELMADFDFDDGVNGRF